MMKLGLILANGSAADDITLARRAEAAGFNSVYAYDFFASNAIARLGGIAAATSRVRLGSAIANTFTRSPMVLAQGALDVDDISGGRLILGLGTGLEKMNVEWYGVPYGKPVTRVRELFPLLREVFATTGPGFSWRGDSWELEVPAYFRPRPHRSEIPLWLAAVNRGMITAAGQIADGMVGHPVHTRKWHREITLPRLDEAADAAARPRDACPLFPQLITSVHRDRDTAVLDAKRQIGFSFSVEHYHSILDLHGLREVGQACRSHLARYDFEAMAGCIPDDLVDEIAIACTPDEFGDRLRLWSGLTPEPLLFPATIGVPPERMAANVDNILSFAESFTASVTD
jgi:alkanesulfonate monooxygenase SsuD/methylene tetrahydromethanopterin reductase-like flavin-dependent oxidoreductase (luciferase family)